MRGLANQWGAAGRGAADDRPLPMGTGEGTRMLVGYVSDERYVALPDALLEFQRGDESVAVARSTARGTVYAEIEPGTYRVTLAKAGFGSKSASTAGRVGSRAGSRVRSLSVTRARICPASSRVPN